MSYAQNLFSVPGRCSVFLVTYNAAKMISIVIDGFPFDPCFIWYLKSYFASGLLVYFFYGYSHSVEGIKPDEGSEVQFILSETPDFGTEVEEYPAGMTTPRTK